MSRLNQHQKLQNKVKLQSERIKKAEKERNTLFAHTIYLGVLGVVLVLPVVVGAYLGLWLDSLASGYSMRWTLSMIFIGVVIGAVNVYLLIRE